MFDYTRAPFGRKAAKAAWTNPFAAHQAQPEAPARDGLSLAPRGCVQPARVEYTNPVAW
jgi:hypothetical protein